jgi:hypothetical protein
MIAKCRKHSSFDTEVRKMTGIKKNHVKINIIVQDKYRLKRGIFFREV